MSRIGKLPIIIPDNVNISYNGSEIRVKGKFGTLENQIPDVIEIQQDDSILKVSLKNEAHFTYNVGKTFGKIPKCKMNYFYYTEKHNLMTLVIS